MITNRIRISTIKSVFLALAIISLPLSLVLETNFQISLVGYIDEIIGVLSGIYILFLIIINKKISRHELNILIMLVFALVLGFISNVKSGLISNNIAILVDALWLCKMFFAYIAAKNIASNNVKEKVIQILLPISKCLIAIAFLLGTINLFKNFGMSGTEQRYGIRSFYFIFNNEGRCGLIVATCLAIVMASSISKNKKKYYELMALVIMIYTTKGVVLIIVGCYILLQILWKHKAKITLKTIIPLMILGLSIGSYQIKVYLMDQTMPRMRFIRYGIETAIEYFPLGSGFATYGSEMAARYYSSLYYKYGFNNIWGMAPEDGGFLNDNYLAMIVAQLGFIGLILFIFTLYIIFDKLNNGKIPIKCKAILMSIYISLVVSSIGTAIIKSSIGVFIFLILGVLVNTHDYKYRKENNGNN